MPEITPSTTVAPGIGGYRVRARPCILCGGERDISYGYTTNQGKRSTRMSPRCKACAAKRRKEKRDAEPERQQLLCRTWREANVDHRAAYNRRRQQDPEVRALKAYHQRLRKARLRSGQDDNEGIREVYRRAKHIERVVARCPVFALPELGYEMQVDHIHPLSRGGRHAVENLQIIPKGINMRKGVRCPR